MTGRKIPTVVVGVASPSFPCARHFGVMHSGTKGGATITDGRKCQRGIVEGEFHHIYIGEDEESRLLSWGSFLLLLRVLDLCYALGEEGVTTITDGRKSQRGVSEGEFHHIYMRGRRIPNVVVGVASPSFPCARHFGVMHSGTK